MTDTRPSTSVFPTSPASRGRSVRGLVPGTTASGLRGRLTAAIACLRSSGLLAAPVPALCLGLCLAPLAASAGEPDATAADASPGRTKRSHIQPVGEMAVAARHQDTLGLRLVRASEVLRQQLALGRGAGLVVEEVAPGSPAERAGIRQHDVLVLLDDQMLLLPEQLAALLEADADAAAECTLLRGGMRLKVALGSPAANERPTLAAAAPAVAQPFLPPQTPADRAAASATRTAAKPSPGPGLRPAASALAIVQPRDPSAARAADRAPRMPSAEPAAPVRRPEPDQPTASRGKATGDETLLRQDPDCQIKLSRGAETRLVVIDSRGRILFNDQIDSPETRAQVPAAVRQRVEEMERALEPRKSAAYEIGRLDTKPVEVK